MDSLDRKVGGISCREVLAGLSDFVDGALAPEVVEALRVHLAGCRNCESFGGVFSAAIAEIRGGLVAAPDEEDAVFARLRDRLDEELGDSS
jgi:anti-sigma factor RsiW